MDAETTSSSMDLLLPLVALVSGATLVVICAGNPEREALICGIKRIILAPVLLCACIFTVAGAWFHLVAWSFRLVGLVTRLVLENVPEEGLDLVDRLHIWSDEFETELHNGNESNLASAQTVAAECNESASSPRAHQH